MSSTPCRGSDPQRTPNWRQDRVLELLDAPGGPRRLRPYDDEEIRGYRKFLRKLRVAEAKAEMDVAGAPSSQGHVLAKLSAEHMEYYFAHQIHFVDPDVRTSVQARILARQSDDEIARCWATCAGAIEKFEKIFFDVRDRLDDSDWIESAVLPYSSASGAVYLGVPHALLMRCAY
jgi:hypothetical protein